jgi:hypothetical protein
VTSGIYGTKGKGSSYTALLPILRGWHRAMRRYSHIHHEKDGDDAGYYSNERANISFLAAGVWMSGHSALEEFVSSKYKNRKKTNGRVDLYICKNDKDNAEIEAKLKWLNAHFGENRLSDHVQAAFKSAIKDAKGVRGADHRYGCVFYVPMFKPKWFSDYKNNDDAVIRKLIADVCRSDKSAIWAWSFPSQTRFIVEKKIFYPGVIMGLKYVD